MEKKFLLSKKRSATPQDKLEEVVKRAVFSKPLETSDQILDPDNANEHEPIHNDVIREPIQLDIASVTQWFIRFFGEEIFNNLRQNPNFQNPMLQEAQTLEDWLTAALKTMFPLEDLKTLGLSIDRGHRLILEQLENSRCQQVEFIEAGKQLACRIQELEHGLAMAERTVKQQKEQLQTSVPTTALISLLLDDKPQFKSLQTKLNQALKDPSEDLSNFMTILCQRLKTLIEVLEHQSQDERQNMESMSTVLRQLLKDLSGHYISGRREILAAIAELVSERFDQYDFISPEETKQVDPSLHKAAGLGGTNVIEGISFAVVRKHTRQVVVYAEVKVS